MWSLNPLLKPIGLVATHFTSYVHGQQPNILTRAPNVRLTFYLLFLFFGQIFITILGTSCDG